MLMISIMTSIVCVLVIVMMIIHISIIISMAIITVQRRTPTLEGSPEEHAAQQTARRWTSGGGKQVGVFITIRHRCS